MGKFADVRESLKRCTEANANFFHRFYEIFKASDDAIPPYFENTDFARQTELLADALNASILFAGGNEIAESAMAGIRVSHSKRALNVLPQHYDFWLESMVATVTESDPDFTDELEQRWRAVLNHAVEYVRGGYDAS